MIKCPKCGENNRDNDRFCLNCGESLKTQVEQKQRQKEIEKRNKIIEERKQKQDTYRDFDRRNTRKTSKNVKNINQGQIQKNKAKNRLSNIFIEIFQTDFHALPILLSALIPGLGFIYYKKWMKTFVFVIISIFLLTSIMQSIYGKLFYVIYWIILMILTHIEN